MDGRHTTAPVLLALCFLGACYSGIPDDPVASYRDLRQAIEWPGYSDYPFVVETEFVHPGDEYCASWRAVHTVVFEWANANEAFIDWHGTTYYVDDKFVLGGFLDGYGGPNFHHSDDDWGMDYDAGNWGEVHWQWIGATVPLDDFNQTIVFDKSWAGGDYGIYGFCSGTDQTVIVFP